MMYYNHQVPKPIYKFEFDFTVYNQYFYDDIMATIFPITIYSYTNLPAPTLPIMISEFCEKACYDIIWKT